MSRSKSTTVKLFEDELDLIVAALHSPDIIDHLEGDDAKSHQRLLNRLYRSGDRL